MPSSLDIPEYLSWDMNLQSQHLAQWTIFVVAKFKIYFPTPLVVHYFSEIF